MEEVFIFARVGRGGISSKSEHYTPTLTHTVLSHFIPTDSGCADGTTEGLQDELHPKIAACEGAWTGHIHNSSGYVTSVFMH